MVYSFKYDGWMHTGAWAAIRMNTVAPIGLSSMVNVLITQRGLGVLDLPSKSVDATDTMTMRARSGLQVICSMSLVSLR